MVDANVIKKGFEIFDPRLLTSFSNSNFKVVIKRALFRTLRGKSSVIGIGDGTGELVALWPYLENEAIKEGVVGVIKWAGKLMMVPVSSIGKDNEGKKVTKYFFTKVPGYQIYDTLKIKLPVPILDEQNAITKTVMVEHSFYPAGNDKDKLFAILENDVEMSPELEGIDDDLTKLESILDAIFHDIVLTKKKIYFVFPQEPDEDDWKKVTAMWENGIMGYVALPKSAQDTGVDKEGIMKEGIDPDKIELKVYQPEGKSRDLWTDYRNFMREMLWKYGIRINTLENKEERASNAEVEDSNNFFDNIDNEKRQTRLNFLDWVTRNWGGKYQLTYK